MTNWGLLWARQHHGEFKGREAKGTFQGSGGQIFTVMRDQLPEGNSYRKNGMLVRQALREQLEKGIMDYCYF